MLNNVRDYIDNILNKKEPFSFSEPSMVFKAFSHSFLSDSNHKALKGLFVWMLKMQGCAMRQWSLETPIFFKNNAKFRALVIQVKNNVKTYNEFNSFGNFITFVVYILNLLFSILYNINFAVYILNLLFTVLYNRNLISLA